MGRIVLFAFQCIIFHCGSYLYLVHCMPTRSPTRLAKKSRRCWGIGGHDSSGGVLICLRCVQTVVGPKPPLANDRYRDDNLNHLMMTTRNAMSDLTLQLRDLSVAGLRACESIAGLTIEGSDEQSRQDEISYPHLGFKVSHSYAKVKGEYIATYIFLFLQNGTRDWIHRLNDEDVYGATYAAFQGRIMIDSLDVTEEAEADIGLVLSKCPSLEPLPRKNETVYVLRGDTFERRIRVEYSSDGRPYRIVLN